MAAPAPTSALADVGKSASDAEGTPSPRARRSCARGSCRAVLGEERRHRGHEALGRLDRPAGQLGRHFGAWAGLVVRDSLEDVGAAEEGPQLRVEARVVPRQPPELAPYARVLLEGATRPLEQQGLRRVQPG